MSLILNYIEISRQSGIQDKWLYGDSAQVLAWPFHVEPEVNNRRARRNHEDKTMKNKTTNYYKGSGRYTVLSSAQNILTSREMLLSQGRIKIGWRRVSGWILISFILTTHSLLLITWFSGHAKVIKMREGILKWNRSERKQSWPILNNYNNVSLEVHNKITKSLKLTDREPQSGQHVTSVSDKQWNINSKV